MEKKYYSETELSQILGISRNTLRTWRKRRTGPIYLKIGADKGKVLYPIEEFKAWEIKCKTNTN